MVVAGLAGAIGCASGRPDGRPEPRPEPGDGQVVAQALKADGHRFDTDGSVASLWAYIEREHQFVPPSHIRPGDVVFFQIDRSDGRCPDHAGWVEEVDEFGRVTFREARYGMLRRSHLTAEAPGERRAPDGRILNSFLRARRPEDPPETRYYAGELLCAVGRVRRPPPPADTANLAKG